MAKPLKDWTLAEVLDYCEQNEGCPESCPFYRVCGEMFITLDMLDGWEGDQQC